VIVYVALFKHDFNGLGLQEAGTIAVVHHIYELQAMQCAPSIEDPFLQIEVVCLHLRHNCERMRNKIGHEEISSANWCSDSVLPSSENRDDVFLLVNLFQLQ